MGSGSTDDVGFQLSSGTLHAVIKPNGKHAFKASGAASLVNVPSVTFSGNNFAAESSTTGADVLVAAGETVLAGVQRVSGNGVHLMTGGVDLQGNFAVERSTSPGDDEILGTGDDSTELLIGASGLSLSVGDSGGVHVSVTNAGFILLLASDNTYAVQAEGTAQVLGISGLTLQGTIGLERNTSTTAVSRQLTIGGHPTRSRCRRRRPH